MAGKSARQKGNRVERKIVAWFRSLGLAARKIPLSGQTADFKDDIELEWPGRASALRVEVKGRKSPPPWKTIKSWLGSADMLVLAEDRADPLIVIPAIVFEALAANARVLPPHPINQEVEV